MNTKMIYTRRGFVKMAAGAVDVTLPGRAQQMGTRHLISRITDGH